MKTLEESFQDAVKNICTNHHKIIDDWCQAYLAQLHGLGIEIRPGCFTLNQMPFNEGPNVGYKYWFTLGTNHMKDDFTLENTLKKNFETNIKGLFEEACAIFFDENLGDPEFEFCLNIIQTTTTYLQSKRKKRKPTT